MISEAKAKTKSQHLETKAEARVSEAKAAVSEAKAICMRMQKLVAPCDFKATTKKANGLVLLVVVIHVPVNLFFVSLWSETHNLTCTWIKASNTLSQKGAISCLLSSAHQTCHVHLILKTLRN